MYPAFVHDCSFSGGKPGRLARQRTAADRERAAAAYSRRSELQGGVLQAVRSDRPGFLHRFRRVEKLGPQLDRRLLRIKSERFRRGRFLPEYQFARKARLPVLSDQITGEIGGAICVNHRVPRWQNLADRIGQFCDHLAVCAAGVSHAERTASQVQALRRNLFNDTQIQVIREK